VTGSGASLWPWPSHTDIYSAYDLWKKQRVCVCEGGWGIFITWKSHQSQTLPINHEKRKKSWHLPVSDEEFFKRLVSERGGGGGAREVSGALVTPRLSCWCPESKPWRPDRAGPAPWGDPASPSPGPCSGTSWWWTLEGGGGDTHIKIRGSTRGTLTLMLIHYLLFVKSTSTGMRCSSLRLVSLA